MLALLRILPTALHCTIWICLTSPSYLLLPPSLPSPASLGVQGHLLRAEGRTSSAEKGMEGRLISLAVSTDTGCLSHVYSLTLISNSAVSWEVRLEEQCYQWLHHGRSHRLQRLVLPAGNCFCDNCDKIEFGYAEHSVLSAAHALQTSFHGVVVKPVWERAPDWQNCQLQG